MLFIYLSLFLVCNSLLSPSNLTSNSVLFVYLFSLFFMNFLALFIFLLLFWFILSSSAPRAAHPVPLL